jgi:hypothetical protein
LHQEVIPLSPILRLALRLLLIPKKNSILPDAALIMKTVSVFPKVLVYQPDKAFLANFKGTMW